MKIRSMMLGLGALALSMGAAAADAPKLSGDQVKIGVLTDMSGVYSAVGGEGAVVAAQMAIEDFGGKVLGKPVRLVSADHQNKPDVASAKARKWIDEDGVDVITELLNSAVGLAVQRLASSKQVITINTGSGTTDLTGDQCSKYGIHYVYDTYALPVGTATAVVEDGGKSWFFITANYNFGKSLQKNTSAVVERLGGSVVGDVLHPIGTHDFSSYLLQAMNSGAEVVALANAGGDTINAIKQANEFGLVKSGQRLVGMLVFITDVKSLGLDIAQGLQFTTAWSWNRTEESRAFAKRFFERHNAMPTMIQAGLYSAITNYLKAVEQVGTDDADAVRAQLGKMKIDDLFAKGHIRADGLFVHDMFLAQVKTPAESQGDWDLVKIVKRIPGDKAFMSLEQGGCPLVSQ